MSTIAFPKPGSKKIHFQAMSGVLLLAGLAIAPNAYRAVGAESAAATNQFVVTLDKAENGAFTVSPELPTDGMVAAGTVLKVKATPNAGFAVDSGYYAIPGPWGRAFIESAGSEFNVVVDRNKAIGVSFIDQKAVEGFKVTHDVVYAQPGVKKLKYDVFTPNGAKNLPAILIIHGGGWTSNTEDVMRGLARELVRGGQYVVMSMDYRWLGTRDGDKTPNTMANLIEDVYGAVAHFQEHAASYGADGTRLAITGDSAGGHLSASAINLADKIGDGGFGVKEGVYQFKPTYMPAGKTADQLRKEISGALKVAAPSYGVFGGRLLEGVLKGNNLPESTYKAVTPQDNIPNVKDRAVPQYLLRGTADMLIQGPPVQEYTDALKAAGQNAVYEQVEGANHAFFDWKPDARTKATFAKYGVPYAAKMKAFFDAVLYPSGSGKKP